MQRLPLIKKKLQWQSEARRDFLETAQCSTVSRTYGNDGRRRENCEIYGVCPRSLFSSTVSCIGRMVEKSKPMWINLKKTIVHLRLRQI